MPLRDQLANATLPTESLSPMELLQGHNSFQRLAVPTSTVPDSPRGSALLRESIQERSSVKKTVAVYMRVPATASTSEALTPLMCDWDSPILTCIAQAMPRGGDLGQLTSSLRVMMDVDGRQVDVTLKSAGEAALLAREHVVVEVLGIPHGFGF
jgi:hypothetical protein